MDAHRDMYAFLDGEVSVETNLEVLQHLNACLPCGRRFEAEKTFEAGTVRVLREETVPAGLRGRLSKALDRAEDARPAGFRLPGGRWGSLAAAAVLCAAVLLTADYACLGPFQCPVILASVEAAEGLEAGPKSSVPAAEEDAPDLSGRGYRKCGCAFAVPAPALGTQACVADYEGPGGRAALVSLPIADHVPKPWNLVRRGGREWFEASAGGRRVLGWREEGRFRALVTRSETLDLAALAEAVRK